MRGQQSLTVRNFQYMEIPVDINSLLLKFVMSPGLMRGDTGRFVNEAYLSSPNVSLKQ